MVANNKQFISCFDFVYVSCVFRNYYLTSFANLDDTENILSVYRVVFYFFFIRPENKKKKKVEDMRRALSVGDEITTIGAMTGKIVQVTEDTVTFETGEDRVRIQIKKWGISTTAKMEAAEAAARANKGKK